MTMTYPVSQKNVGPAPLDLGMSHSTRYTDVHYTILYTLLVIFHVGHAVRLGYQ